MTSLQSPLCFLLFGSHLGILLGYCYRVCVCARVRVCVCVSCVYACVRGYSCAYVRVRAHVGVL